MANPAFRMHIAHACGLCSERILLSQVVIHVVKPAKCFLLPFISPSDFALETLSVRAQANKLH